MKKLNLMLITAIFFTLFFTTTVSAQVFPDLPAWAEDEIIYLNKEKIVQGRPDGTFGSNTPIKRGDASLMIAHAKRLNTNISTKPTFPDVKKNMYYYGAIEAAVKAGFLNGHPNGNFSPKNNLTRQEMAKIITGAYNLDDRSGHSFTDSSKSWAAKDIEALAHNGIAAGMPDGTFRPKNNVSRAEFSAVLARTMNNDFKIELKLSQFEKQVVKLTNNKRIEAGLNPLKIDNQLSRVAREKSHDMVINNYFDHTSPTYGSPFNMMHKYGISYLRAGENIAQGHVSPKEVVNAWINSPEHRENIMNPSFTHIGSGYDKISHHWTQMFILKKH